MGAQAPGEQSFGWNTWDASHNGSPVAYRPQGPDYNGAQLEFRADAPPNAPSQPTANQLNGTMLVEQGIGAVIPNATISVKYASGSPVIDYGTTCGGTTPGSTGPLQTAGAVNIERTPGGASSGDVFVWAPSGVFPVPVAHPKVSLNGFVPGMCSADWFTDSGSGHSGIRIVTVNASNAATDLPFTFDWM